MALRKGRCRLPELLGDMLPTDLASLMKVADSTVSRWINGEREMSYENAVLAARVLNCHAEDMYHWIIVKKGKRQ